MSTPPIRAMGAPGQGQGPRPGQFKSHRRQASSPTSIPQVPARAMVWAGVAATPQPGCSSSQESHYEYWDGPGWMAVAIDHQQELEYSRGRPTHITWSHLPPGRSGRDQDFQWQEIGSDPVVVRDPKPQPRAPMNRAKIPAIPVAKARSKPRPGPGP